MLLDGLYGLPSNYAVGLGILSFILVPLLYKNWPNMNSFEVINIKYNTENIHTGRFWRLKSEKLYSQTDALIFYIRGMWNILPKQEAWEPDDSSGKL